MGALCGKESSNNSDNFQGQGRPLGSAPPERPAAPTAPLPPNKRPGATAGGGQGRTLGGGGGAAGASSSSTTPGDDPGRRAAEAAQARAQAARGKGKLAAELHRQKAQPQSELVRGDAERNARQQAVDQQQQTLNWN